MFNCTHLTLTGEDLKLNLLLKDHRRATKKEIGSWSVRRKYVPKMLYRSSNIETMSLSIGLYLKLMENNKGLQDSSVISSVMFTID